MRYDLRGSWSLMFKTHTSYFFVGIEAWKVGFWRLLELALHLATTLTTSPKFFCTKKFQLTANSSVSPSEHLLEDHLVWNWGLLIYLSLGLVKFFWYIKWKSAGMVPVTSARWVLPHHTTSVEDPKAPMSGPNLSSTTCGWCKDFVSSNRGLWGLEHEPCPSKSCERVQGFGINLFPNRRERFV